MHKERNSSLELLRIIAIQCIICSHFCVHSGFETLAMSFSFNKILLQVGALGNLGVVIFVMISGYFLSQLNCKLSRVVRVILQTVFYSVAIYVVFAVLKNIPFSLTDFIKVCFPITFSQYWFATIYVVLAILTPFINILLNHFTKKQFLWFLGILLLLFSVIPTIMDLQLKGTALVQFLLYYSIGAFARKYQNAISARKYGILIAASSSVLLILSTVVLNLLAIKRPAFNQGTYFFTRYSVLIISLAYGLLLIFANTKIKPNRLINLAGASTFGIYLIHDNNYLRGLIWIDIFGAKGYQESPYLVLYLLLCVASVFVVCVVLDYIRQKLLERPLMKLLGGVLNKLDIKIQTSVDKLASFLQNSGRLS